mmetsp:Transcript_25028/g.59119  ORF Transcript_25028/g.59119 Transcript_25028/m.59119 type:complete len:230 (-) Transcript_25028:158-847(-)|eukprot:CAMPEP_0117045566 /NCGR_PEP_ID=MMETSP0472-20121206/31526_1 /TAXON_ID=693140 ORGANISM="Tiarina fusus, Strain LIS" /NCGR_SAMPLE_ID=MMETSP0472 /ASSEMBLY_ACC=CAM_ASM_000603 /LENGTH=229 /DNA_ID=CAMNT_0004757623 /DNA_START=78 /DNA_END=767 /DNA_ORIENTATION=-
MGVPDFLQKDHEAPAVDVFAQLEVPSNMAEMKVIGDRERMLIPMLSHVLEALVRRNDLLVAADKTTVTAFHALKAPAVAVPDYVERIRKYSLCSPCCFVIGLVFMDRYLQRNPDFILSSLSVHRLVLTSVLLAAKFLDDFYYNNSFWAKVGGIPVAELNALELELLFKLNFDLHVSVEEYIRYRGTLLHSHQGGIEAAKKSATLCSEAMFKQQQQFAAVEYVDAMCVEH